MPILNQPLSVVCNVSVNVSPVAPATPTFNQMLIVGPSAVIPTSGANSRVRQYTSVAAMLTDGFTLTQPEVLAAQLYFGAVPAPQILWVGRQDLTVPESALTALQACRVASPNWWCCMVTDAATADHEAIAAWIQAATPASVYLYGTADAAVLANTAGNVLLTLQTAQYSRAMGIYSTTQSSAYPNNAYIAAAVGGMAMGLNTGLANSNFTAKFKVLPGVAAEPLTATQIGTIEGSNGNIYTPVGNAFNWLEQGVMANGQYFDEVLNLDMLASDLQYSMIDALISAPSIPHDDAGQTQLLAIANAACDRAVTRGFIATGTWNGQTVLNLSANTPLPKGYLCQSDKFANQSAGDRQARKSMPIYICLVEAGSMHSVTIGVYVQR